MLYLIVFFGAGIGGALRHGVNVGAAKLFGYGFPYGTLIVNVAGSFLMGLLAGYFAFRPGIGLPGDFRQFVMVGICGGYTTFSTFSLDTWYLIERNQIAASALYVVGSVVLSIGALIGALQIVRSIPH